MHHVFHNPTYKRILIFIIAIIGFNFIWLRGGFTSLGLDTDIGRDLSDISPLWQHHPVWLGPHLSGGLQASPLYYYSLFPLIWISKGNANSVIISTMIVASVVIGICIYGLQKNKSIIATLFLTLLISILPWWQTVAIHPGNGYTYAVFIFAALACLWFELPIVIGSACISAAIAYHPAAIFVLPFLGYEWLRRGHKVREFLYISGIMIIPWLPIIAFEIITKGFLIRQFLAPHGTTIHPGFNLLYLSQVAAYVGIPVIVLVIYWVSLLFVVSGRTRLWYIFLSIILISFAWLGRLEAHYVFGLTAMITFFGIIAVTHSRWHTYAKIALLIFLIFRLITIPISVHQRTIPKMTKIVDQLLNSQSLDPSKRYAVVAAIESKTQVPQADDYRYLLRVKGINVLNVQSYAEAERLLMFIEHPEFNWKTWGSWEIDQFGSKQILNEFDSEGVHVIQWTKQY